MVDQALEVVEEYQGRILKIEQAVLLKPSMKTVRRRKSSTSLRWIDFTHLGPCLTVHILQGDLILHKRTLEPIKTVIYGLRRYDVDRVLALRENTDGNTKVEGYMSHKSKIYLVRLSSSSPLPTCPSAFLPPPCCLLVPGCCANLFLFLSLVRIFGTSTLALLPLLRSFAG